MRSKRRTIAIASVALALLLGVVLTFGSVFFAYQAQSVRLLTPQGILEDLPVYSQAQDVRIVDRQSQTPMLNYKVNAKASDVLAFYGNWFSQNGWYDDTPATSHNSVWFAGDKRVSTLQWTDSFPWVSFEQRSVRVSLIIAAYTVDVEGTDGTEVVIRPPQITRYNIIK